VITYNKAPYGGALHEAARAAQRLAPAEGQDIQYSFLWRLKSDTCLVIVMHDEA